MPPYTTYCTADVIMEPRLHPAEHFMHEHVYGTLHWLAAAQMDLSNYRRLTQS